MAQAAIARGITHTHARTDSRPLLVRARRPEVSDTRRPSGYAPRKCAREKSGGEGILRRKKDRFFLYRGCARQSHTHADAFHSRAVSRGGALSSAYHPTEAPPLLLSLSSS